MRIRQRAALGAGVALGLLGHCVMPGGAGQEPPRPSDGDGFSVPDEAIAGPLRLTDLVTGTPVVAARRGLLLAEARSEEEPSKLVLLRDGEFRQEPVQPGLSDWLLAGESWWSWAPLEPGAFVVRTSGASAQADAEVRFMQFASPAGVAVSDLLQAMRALLARVRAAPHGAQQAELHRAKEALGAIALLEQSDETRRLLAIALHACDDMIGAIDAVDHSEHEGLEPLLALAQKWREQVAHWLGDSSVLWRNAIYWEGGLLRRLGRDAEAGDVLELGRLRAAELWGLADRNTVMFALYRARCLARSNRAGEALALCMAHVKELRRAESRDTELVLDALQEAVVYATEEPAALPELLDAADWARLVFLNAGVVSAEATRTYAAIQQSLGNYLIHAGRVPEGIERMGEARRTLVAIFPAGDPVLVVDSHGLAESLLLIGRAREAWDQVGGLLEDVRAMAPENPWPASHCLNIRGKVLMALGQHGEAVLAFEEALTFLPEADEAWAQHRGVLMGSLGAAQAANGDTQGALTTLRAAESRYLAALRPTHPDRLRIRQTLAEVLFARGQLAESVGIFAELLDQCREELGNQHPRVAEIGAAMAHAALLHNDPALSRSAARVGLAAADAQRRADSAVMTDTEAAARFAGSDDLSGLLLSLAVHGTASPDEALEAVLRRQGVVLDSIAARAAAAHVLRDSAARGAGFVSQAWDDLSSARARLSAAFRTLDSSQERNAERLQQAWREVEVAERRLSEASPDFALLARAAEVDVADVRAALGEGESLVSYVQYAPIVPGEDGTFTLRGDMPRLCAITLTPRGAAQVVDLGPVEPVESLVAAFLASVDAVRRRTPELQPLATNTRIARRDAQVLEKYEREAAQHLHDLAKLLWLPLPEDVRGASRVFIAPGGSLHRLPFAALVPQAPREGEPPAYLIEEGPQLVMVAGPRQLVRAALSPQAGEVAQSAWRGLVLGPPAFEAASGFAPLDAFADDLASNAERLSEALGAPHVLHLTGADATELAFREYAPAAAVIGVFTHGLLDPGTSQPGAGMLRSRLALSQKAQPASSTDPEDDGSIAGAEVLQLDLRQARVVLLTACHSGEGAFSSDGLGLEGLRAAFIAAGANSTIGNLWEVPAQQAAYLTSQFYGHWLDGDAPTDAATAHHRAQLDTLEVVRSRHPLRGWTTGHPYFWAFATFGGGASPPPRPPSP